MTIENKLNQLIQAKQDIKNSIEAKGITVGDAALAEYSDKIFRIGGSGEEVVEEGLFITKREKTSSTSSLYTVEIYGDSDNKFDNRKFGTDETSLLIPMFSTIKRDLIVKSTVREIATYAFNSFAAGERSRYNFGRVVFEEGLRKIGQGAFQNSSFEEVPIFPDSLTTLAAQGLYGLVLPIGSTINLKNISSFGQGSVANITAREIIAPKMVTVSNSIFGVGNQYLKKVTLGSVGNRVSSMAASVFYQNEVVEEIYIYVTNPSNPNLAGAPWGATNATITYLQA